MMCVGFDIMYLSYIPGFHVKVNVNMLQRKAWVALVWMLRIPTLVCFIPLYQPTAVLKNAIICHLTIQYAEGNQRNREISMRSKDNNQ